MGGANDVLCAGIHIMRICQTPEAALTCPMAVMKLRVQNRQKSKNHPRYWICWSKSYTWHNDNECHRRLERRQGARSETRGHENTGWRKRVGITSQARKKKKDNKQTQLLALSSLPQWALFSREKKGGQPEKKAKKHQAPTGQNHQTRSPLGTPANTDVRAQGTPHLACGKSCPKPQMLWVKVKRASKP